MNLEDSITAHYVKVQKAVLILKVAEDGISVFPETKLIRHPLKIRNQCFTIENK